MRNATRGGVAAISIAAALGACTHRTAAVGSPAAPSQSVDASCSAAIGSLPLATNVAAMAGTFQLTLVADAGPRNGNKVGGTLRLDPPVRSASAPTQLTGTATIALETVGATAPGPLTSTAIPATAVQWAMAQNGTQTPQITIRLGTTTAPSGTRMIEGPHMALHVGVITGDGFSGRWESGTGGMEVQPAAGYFCAKGR